MSLPLYLHIFGYRIHPHPFFETLAYLVGARLFFWLRGKRSAQPLPLDLSLWIFGACIIGAMMGSKTLAWLESPAAYWNASGEFSGWESGKTIVGGILGAWLCIELVKKQFGVTAKTGDAFVFPLLIGTALGRVGCFLTGLADRTHGIPCGLPWCLDYGDGISRHPTQLYEIAFLLLYGVCLLLRIRKPYRSGYLFRLYVFAYLLFRFCVEFIKPRQIAVAGLSAIQIASFLGAAWSLYSLQRMVKDEQGMMK